LVLKPDITDIKISGEEISAGAGASVADVLRIAAENGLSGLEWAGGLPGTFGGAIRCNAGAFGARSVRGSAVVSAGVTSAAVCRVPESINVHPR
jgi:UDP-N-acetylmuramate dehydrogenase